jgi:hypothetical protein
MTTPEVIEGPLNPAEKKVLRQFEAEITSALHDASRAGAVIGKALWDISDEQLYRGTHTTFAEYVEDRWDMSKSRAYRLIEIAKAHAAHPELPIPSQYAIERARPKVEPKRPNVGTLAPAQHTSDQPVPDPEPPIIDAEGWEVPEPKALLAPAVESDAYQTHDPGPGDATSAPSNGPGAVPSPGPVPILVHDEDGEYVASGKEAASEKPAWKCGTCGGGITTHQPGCQWEASFLQLQDGASIPSAGSHAQVVLDRLAEAPLCGRLTTNPRTVEALIDLLSSADLEALGAAMTEDQVDTVMRAAEDIRDAWAIANKPRERLSKAQRVKAGQPAVTARSAAPLGRREVTPMFKQKAKVG